MAEDDIASEPQSPIDSSDDDDGKVSHRGYCHGYTDCSLRRSDSSYADGYSLLRMNQVAARSIKDKVTYTDLESETEESDKYRVIQAIRRFFSCIFPSKAALKTQTQTPQGKQCDSG